MTVDTGKMLFLCAGAFETLYDQVFQRVTSPKSGIKLPTTTVYDNGKIQIREYFTLRHHFRPEDLFEYGMQPQFLSRFDNAIILDDLNAEILSRIFTELSGRRAPEPPRTSSRNTASTSTSPTRAVHKIADEAAKTAASAPGRSSRSTAGSSSRSSSTPSPGPRWSEHGGGRKLVIDEELVASVLKSPY